MTINFWEKNDNKILETNDNKLYCTEYKIILLRDPTYCKMLRQIIELWFSVAKVTL